MLSKSQIEANIKKFHETNGKYNIFTQELLSFLGEAFFLAPASTQLDMFGCYPGGLLNHSFKAAKYAIQTNDILPEHIKKDIGTILKCVLLSQIGKSFLYIENPSEWHKKNLGKIYDFNPDLISLRVGERSVYYAMTHGIKLTEEEFQAIINIDKDPDDKQARYFSQPLTYIVKQGVELAILEEKNSKK